MATVPMLSPDGSVGDVPQARVHDAVAKGFKIAVDMKSPDGQLGTVPLEGVHAAISKGFRIATAPAAGGEDLIKQDVAKAQSATRAAGPYTPAGAAEAGMGFGVPASQTLQDSARAVASGANAAAPVFTAGASLPIQMAAQGGAAAAQSATEGGSAGDIAKSGAVGAAIPPVAAGVSAAVSALANSPTVRALVKAAPKVAVKQSYFGKVGLELLKIAREAGEDVDGLMSEHPTNPGAPLPATPAPEQLNPALVSPARTLPGQVAPETIAPEQPIPGVTSRPFIERVQPNRGLLLTGESPETSLNRIRELPTPEKGIDPEIRPSIERIIDEAHPPNTDPVANFQAKAKANYHLSALEEQLSSALGGKKLVPGVPLKNQASAMQETAARLPEGFTPVESSALNGYKYDPSAQTFESITKNGEHYVHGEVDPQTAQAFVDAESKGLAWNRLRNAPGVTYLGKMRGGKILPAQPPSALRTSMRVEEPPEGTTVPTESNQLGLLEKMLEEALSKKGR